MVENIDINAVAKELNKEFDELIDERTKIRSHMTALKVRADEIDRKLSGIQKTLQGFSLYANAQEAPTEITKKAPIDVDAMLGAMDERMKTFLPAVDVRKTLTECCRDILRQKQDWMTPVQVREALFAAGYDFSSYTSNPLSSIHTTINRMVPDEVITETRPEGKVYRWKTIEVEVN